MKKNRVISITGLLFALLALFIILQPGVAQRPYIKNFDLNRYLGQWYEIARFPHSFEKGILEVALPIIRFVPTARLK